MKTKGIAGLVFNKKIQTFLVATVIMLGILSTGTSTDVGSIQVWAASSITESRHQLDSYADVYELVMDSVVSINTTSEVMQQETGFFYPFGGMTPSQPNTPRSPREVRGAGSGIIFFEDDYSIYIITNFHVIDNVKSCFISLDDEIQVPARYIGGDAFNDIAIIAVYKSDMEDAGIDTYQIAIYGSSDEMRMGDQVMAVGNALGDGKTVTLGIISAKNKQITIDSNSYTVLQTDAAINRGNSGGPLVNMRGEVIGINVAKLSSSSVEGMGFAIPTDVIINIAEEIMEKGTIIRPFLGISGATLTFEEDDDNEFDLVLPETGVYVDGVMQEPHWKYSAYLFYWLLFPALYRSAVLQKANQLKY